MTRRCRCKSVVSEDYVRVFAPDDLDEEDYDVRACPNCTAVRRKGSVRTGRSKGRRGQKGAVATTDGGEA